MIVIFIGADNTGKTTIARRVSSHFNWELRKFMPASDEDKLTIVYDLIEEMTIRKSHGEPHLICDRMNYPDDLVYGPIIDGRPSLFRGLEGSLERQLNDLDTLLIYTEADLGDVKKRFESEGDWLIKIETIPAIVKNYEQFLRDTSMCYIRINTSDTSLDECVNIAIRAIGGYL